MNNLEHVVLFKDPNPYDDVNYGFLYPAANWDIEFIAEKDVPLGMPYLILSQSALPPNFPLEKDFYTIDFSSPDGFGSGSYYYMSGSLAIQVDSPFILSGSFNYETWLKNKGLE